MVRGKALDNCVLVLLSLWLCIHSLPIAVKKSEENTAPKEHQPNDPQRPDTGLHYDRYLREVVEYLEKDPHFREKLENSMEPGKLANELSMVHNNLRTKLDELKREEMNRLRMLIKAKHDMELGDGSKVDYQALLKQFEHLNHDNAHSFEIEDLDRLIKATTKDLTQFDKQHHDEFKRYEMMKEHERREKLKTMSEEERKKEEQHHEEMKKKHADHTKVNHPEAVTAPMKAEVTAETVSQGSEDQLKKVWEESDGLEPDDFDPKTFFKLHDSNGDGFLDENELEALFVKELEKVYNSNNEEDDMMEMEEERLRMREHVLSEVDTNKDRLVSLAEFLDSTKKPQFHQNEEWETLEQQNSPYTEEELAMFEQQLAKDSKKIAEEVAELQKQRENLKNQQDILEIQKRSLQQAMSEVEKRKVKSKSDVKCE